MAVEFRQMMKPRIEAPPSLISFPLRPSSTPKLETIREERPDEYEEDKEDDDDETMTMISDELSGYGKF